MKELIIEALDSAFEKLEKEVPQTKKKIEQIGIEGLNPLDLPEFIKENNIPNNCYFTATDNAECATALLEWEELIPLTTLEILKYKQSRFDAIALSTTYLILTKNGYKNIYTKRFSKDRCWDTLFDAYIAKEWDRIIEYYSEQYLKLKQK